MLWFEVTIHISSNVPSFGPEKDLEGPFSVSTLEKIYDEPSLFFVFKYRPIGNIRFCFIVFGLLNDIPQLSCGHMVSLQDQMRLMKALVPNQTQTDAKVTTSKELKGKRRFKGSGYSSCCFTYL